MKLDRHVIDCYINQEPIHKQDEELYGYTNGKRIIQDNRQEVCLSLCEELFRYETFPLWNQSVYKTVFGKDLECLQSITILPIVGADASFDCEVISYHGATVLMIDLLNIADYTNIIAQMNYILHNQIHLKLTMYLLNQKYPKPKAYQDILTYHFFGLGFAHFLAWKDNLQDVFANAQYDQRKQHSFTLLKKAITVEDENIQKDIIKTLNNCNLWDDFALCAGMFFFSACYQEEQEKGLHALYMQDPYQLFKTLF